MSSLVVHLLAAHRMLSRELRRESRRKHPDAARIARLRAERRAVKERVGRHAPKPKRNIAFFRAVLLRILHPGRARKPSDTLSKTH